MEATLQEGEERTPVPNGVFNMAATAELNFLCRPFVFFLPLGLDGFWGSAPCSLQMNVQHSVSTKQESVNVQLISLYEADAEYKIIPLVSCVHPWSFAFPFG